MSREVIQDFLNLTGVVGLALTNRRMRPYFYGLDAILDRTKQALGQGVLQVVENVPEGFESFEFHFSGHVVFIYKLTHGLVLLVLTDSSMKPIDYRRGITKIKYLIETDTYNTVSYFKLLLGSVTQHSLPSSNWSNSNQAIATASNSNIQTQTGANRAQTPPAPASIPLATAATNTASNTANIKATTAATTAATNTASIRASSTTAPTNTRSSPATVTSSNSATKSVSAKTDAQDYKLDELLIALNKLSQFTTQYLGKVVVTNYWKSTRPDASWLAEFEIDRSGKITHPKQAAIACNPEQLQQIQAWVTAYVKRCKQVIRNFDQMLAQDCLDLREKQILLLIST
jgi:hypothetical protein